MCAVGAILNEQMTYYFPPEFNLKEAFVDKLAGETSPQINCWWPVRPKLILLSSYQIITLSVQFKPLYLSMWANSVVQLSIK